jgi:hypothetical protein
VSRPPEELEGRERLARLRELEEPRAGAPLAPAPRSPRPPIAADVDPDELSQTIFAVLSGTQRKGRWEPPAELHAIAVMGGIELDFRDADLLEGETVVDCLAIMGGVNITVPPDVSVRTSGFGFLGGFASVDHRAEDPGAPTLHVKGFAFMGGINVRVKRPGRRRPEE